MIRTTEVIPTLRTIHADFQRLMNNVNNNQIDALDKMIVISGNCESIIAALIEVKMAANNRIINLTAIDERNQS